MPLYECVFIARQDVPGAQVETLTQTFSNVIAENGGQVGKTEYWGLKSFTYKIKKNRKGHYVLMNIDAPFPAVAEMERQMRLNEDILAKYLPEMRNNFYDPTKYKTYLDQLGIKYPTVRACNNPG